MFEMKSSLFLQESINILSKQKLLKFMYNFFGYREFNAHRNEYEDYKLMTININNLAILKQDYFRDKEILQESKHAILSIF